MSASNFQVQYLGLTLQDQVELGRRMKELNDSSARETLIINCIPLVKNIAGIFFKNIHSRCFSFDDLFQEGMLGVIEAINNYDYTKNVKFSSHAYIYIYHRITTGIRRMLPVKVGRADYFNCSLVKSTVESFILTFNRIPSDKEVADNTGLKIEDVCFFRKNDISEINLVSNLHEIDNNQGVLDVGNPTCHSLCDFNILLENILNNELNSNVIKEALDAVLDENQKQIIIARYLTPNKKIKVKDLAVAQQVSEPCIVYREKKALELLFEYFVKKNIKISDLIM